MFVSLLFGDLKPNHNTDAVPDNKKGLFLSRLCASLSDFRDKNASLAARRAVSSEVRPTGKADNAVAQK
jgi:hypothetical protein